MGVDAALAEDSRCEADAVGGDFVTTIADPLLPEGKRTSHAPVYELKLGAGQRHVKAVEGEAHTPVLAYAGIGASVA